MEVSLHKLLGEDGGDLDLLSIDHAGAASDQAKAHRLIEIVDVGLAHVRRRHDLASFNQEAPPHHAAVDREDAGAAFLLKLGKVRKMERELILAIGEVQGDLGRRNGRAFGHAAAAYVHCPWLASVTSDEASPPSDRVWLKDVSRKLPE